MGLNAIATIESKTAAVMDPFKLANDLLYYCCQNGMQVFDRTNITSVQTQKRKCIAHTENKFTITADHVIYCSGYESTETIEEKIVDLKSTYALASEVVPELPAILKNAVIWDTSSPYYYYRATSDNRIIMGGGDEEFRDAKKRDKLIPKKETSLMRQFKRRFPDVKFKLDYYGPELLAKLKTDFPISESQILKRMNIMF